MKAQSAGASFPDRTYGQAVNGPHLGVWQPWKDQCTRTTFPEMIPGFLGIEAGQRSGLRRSCWLVAKQPLPLHCPSFSVLSGVGGR